MTAPTLAPGHPDLDTQNTAAGGTQTSPAATRPSSPNQPAPQVIQLPDGQSDGEFQTAPAVGTLSLTDPLLTFLAESLSDLEAAWVAANNRLAILTRSEPDSDGEIRGWGLSENVPAVAAQAAIADALKKATHQATLVLQRQLRTHPLRAWVKRTHGVGEKQGARLLAALGDPYWNTLYDRPRTVSELWAYCGYKPGQRRRKGERANWSPEAKMRAYLVADKCVQTGKAIDSDYYRVYAARKAATEGRLHAEPCRRCGPKGHPAQPGSPWSKAHRNTDAKRVLAKRILRDLWIEARAIHGETQ